MARQKNTRTLQVFVKQEVNGWNFRLKVFSEVNGNEWASVTEFSFVGCTDLTFGKEEKTTSILLNAFPITTSGQIKVPLPEGQQFHYSIISSAGKQILQGKIENPVTQFSFDLSRYLSGVYFIRLVDDSGRTFRVKVLKE